MKPSDADYHLQIIADAEAAVALCAELVGMEMDAQSSMGLRRLSNATIGHVASTLKIASIVISERLQTLTELCGTGNLYGPPASVFQKDETGQVEVRSAA